MHKSCISQVFTVGLFYAFKIKENEQSIEIISHCVFVQFGLGLTCLSFRVIRAYCTMELQNQTCLIMPASNSIRLNCQLFFSCGILLNNSVCNRLARSQTHWNHVYVVAIDFTRNGHDWYNINWSQPTAVFILPWSCAKGPWLVFNLSCAGDSRYG